MEVVELPEALVEAILERAVHAVRKDLQGQARYDLLCSCRCARHVVSRFVTRLSLHIDPARARSALSLPRAIERLKRFPRLAHLSECTLKGPHACQEEGRDGVKASETCWR